MRPSALTSSPASGLDDIHPLQPVLPRWVSALVAVPDVLFVNGVEVRLSADLALLETRVPHADELSSDDFRDAVRRAYEALGLTLARIGRTAIRVWNYLPDPNRRMRPGLDRYMVFNEGRAEGYGSWYAGREETPAPPTATALGTCRTLVIQLLATTGEGQPVENPRQVPAWRYSRRYGPAPPRFSRATIATLGGRRQLLVGGTASIVGEDSQHVGDVRGQIEETLRNIRLLVETADPGSGEASALARLRDVRAYLTRAEDAPLVGRIIASRCPHLAHLELLLARLCRPELLVEIEGVADLSPQG